MRAEASAELVTRARHDRAAFGDLYRMYAHRVYAFCLMHARGRHEHAEDMTAQTFERAFRAIGQYEERGKPFSRWLLCIASNCMAERIRRDGRVILLGDEALPTDELADALDTDPNEMVDLWEQADLLQKHMDTLSPDQREALRLRFYDDLTVRDVAAGMGRSEDATRQLLHRAIVALRASVAAHEEKVNHDRPLVPADAGRRRRPGVGTPVGAPRPAHARQSAGGGGPAG
jgi:RNA polymerase sigma-70 factor (ECF subfamily)